MKNIYITPKTIVIQLVTEPLMNVISGESGNSGIGSGSAGNQDPELSSRHRSEWGNLW